jgi:hypothetical protein
MICNFMLKGSCTLSQVLYCCTRGLTKLTDSPAERVVEKRVGIIGVDPGLAVL